MKLIGNIRKDQQDMLIGDRLAFRMTKKNGCNVVEWQRYYNGKWIITAHVETEQPTVLAYLISEVEKIHCPQCGEKTASRQTAHCQKAELL